MTTGSIFWAVIIAGSGGVLVLVGLLMELVSEKPWHKNIGDFKRCKSRKLWGEWFVIMGIVIEIFVAGGTAIDEWQTRQIATKNNPLNLPISDISARMVVQLKGADAAEGMRHGSGLSIRGSLVNLGSNGTGSLDAWVRPGGTYGFFPVTNMNGGLALIVNNSLVKVLSPSGYETSQFGVLESDGFQKISSGEDSHEYSLYFHTSTDAVSAKDLNRQPTVNEVISNANWLDIWCDFIPTNAEIMNGSVEIIINGAFPIKFQVLPKKGEDAAVENGFGFGMVATNAILETDTSFASLPFVVKNGKSEFPTNMTIPGKILIGP